MTPAVDDCPRLEVSADGRGMTGRAGLGLLARTADRIGLTTALSDAVSGCRSWKDHDPGKVVRDIVLTLADGGDALRHLKVLEGQPELFGQIAPASTANRTMVALGDDELVVERFASARLAARQRVWAAGGAPPVVAAAQPGEDDEGGRDWRLYLGVDATLIACQRGLPRRTPTSSADVQKGVRDASVDGVSGPRRRAGRVVGRAGAPRECGK